MSNLLSLKNIFFACHFVFTYIYEETDTDTHACVFTFTLFLSYSDVLLIIKKKKKKIIKQAILMLSKPFGPTCLYLVLPSSLHQQWSLNTGLCYSAEEPLLHFWGYLLTSRLQPHRPQQWHFGSSKVFTGIVKFFLFIIILIVL